MAQTLTEQIADKLSPYLGPFNARVAVKTFSKREFGIVAEELTIDHLPGLLEAMRPMLKTLAGRSVADQLVERIRREVA